MGPFWVERKPSEIASVDGAIGEEHIEQQVGSAIGGDDVVQPVDCDQRVGLMM